MRLGQGVALSSKPSMALYAVPQLEYIQIYLLVRQAPCGTADHRGPSISSNFPTMEELLMINITLVLGFVEQAGTNARAVCGLRNLAQPVSWKLVTFFPDMYQVASCESLGDLAIVLSVYQRSFRYKIYHLRTISCCG